MQKGMVMECAVLVVERMEKNVQKHQQTGNSPKHDGERCNLMDELVAELAGIVAVGNSS